MAKMKKMPQKSNQAPMQPADAGQPQVEFDAWFAARESKIPSQHVKEIIKADFKGRGLGRSATMKEFDEALKKYGIKLV